MVGKQACFPVQRCRGGCVLACRASMLAFPYKQRLSKSRHA